MSKYFFFKKFLNQLIFFLISRFFIGPLPKLSDSDMSSRRALRALRAPCCDPWPCPPLHSRSPLWGWWPQPCRDHHILPLIIQQALSSNRDTTIVIFKIFKNLDTLFHAYTHSLTGNYNRPWWSCLWTRHFWDQKFFSLIFFRNFAKYNLQKFVNQLSTNCLTIQTILNLTYKSYKTMRQIYRTFCPCWKWKLLKSINALNPSGENSFYEEGI